MTQAAQVTKTQVTVTVAGRQWSCLLHSFQLDMASFYLQASIPANTGFVNDYTSDQQFTAVTVDKNAFGFNPDVAIVTNAGRIVQIIRSLKTQPQPVTFTGIARYFISVNAGEMSGISAGNLVTITFIGAHIGSYSSIAITAPSTAEEGEQVSMSTLVTNISAYDLLFKVVLYAMRDIYAVPTSEETIGTMEVVIGGGQSQTISGTFIMPAWDTNILVMVHRFIDYWDSDNYATMAVSLGGILAGTIIKWELEYDDKQVPIPAGNVSIGKRGKIHVVGRNIMATPQEMGCTWRVTDPDGIVVEEHIADWAGWPWPTDVDPNDTHEFISFLDEGFDFNKLGTWTISIGLWMNSASPVMVASYEGVLCSVVAVVYEGEIIKKELEYSGGGDGTVPVANVPIGVDAKFHVWGKNNMSIPQGMGIHWIVTDPDGVIIENYEDWGGTIGAGQDHEFVSSSQFDLDKAGKYFVSIDLLMGTQFNPIVVDALAGELCTVEVGEVEEDFVLIRDEKYALASTYYGNAERSTVTFSVIAPSFMISSDKVDQMVTSFEEKFAEEGVHMLELKLYEKRGLVRSDYSADIVTTLPEASGQAVAPTLFGISTGVFIAIIIAVCLIVGLIIILVVRKDVNQFLFGTPPTDEEPGVPGLVDMIGSLVVVMMMIMMMELMGEMFAPVGAPPRPKPVTEAAVRAAKAAVKAAPAVGKAVVKAVPVGVKAVKEVTKRL